MNRIMHETSSPSRSQSQLPRSINKFVPTPGPHAQAITALIRHGGRVSGYQLADGQKLTKQEGIALAKEGGILGVAVAERNGSEYLRTLPGEDRRNLADLPSTERDS